jgi:hypothetical protein
MNMPAVIAVQRITLIERRKYISPPNPRPHTHTHTQSQTQTQTQT